MNVLDRLSQRRGFTLAELIAVVAILGIVAAIAIGRMGPAVFSDVAVHTDARRLAIDLLAAQRRSIATGDNHYLGFTLAGGRFAGYSVTRVTASGDVVVDSSRQFSGGLTVTGTHARAEFTFDGSALANYQYTLTAPDRNWQVEVIPATGTVRVREL